VRRKTFNYSWDETPILTTQRRVAPTAMIERSGFVGVSKFYKFVNSTKRQ